MILLIIYLKFNSILIRKIKESNLRIDIDKEYESSENKKMTSGDDISLNSLDEFGIYKYN